MVVQPVVDTHKQHCTPSSTDVLLSHRFAAVDTLLLDVSIRPAAAITAAAVSAGTTVIPFRYVISPTATTTTAKQQTHQLIQSHDDAIDELTDASDDVFFASRISGETRALFGTKLNLALGHSMSTTVDEAQTTDRTGKKREEYDHEETELEITTFRMVTPSNTLSPTAVLPSLDARRRVLHVAGATSSSFYKGVSDMYALESIRYLSINSGDINSSSSSSSSSDEKNDDYHPVSDLFTHMIAYIHADDGSWSVSADATTFDIDTAPRMSAGDAIAAITRLQPDVMQPHMYDYAGMTSFRGLFEDVLNIPVMGANSAAMALSTHKARTLAVARQAGVSVASSVVVRKVSSNLDEAQSEGKEEEGGQAYDVCGTIVKVSNAEQLVDHLGFKLPVMVKPAEEDNSLGIRRACTSAEFASALHSAFTFGDDVLIEAYIPLGREVRVAVVENGNGELSMLPTVEYLFSDGGSVRTPTDKLELDADGNPIDFSKKTRRRLPADDTMSKVLLGRLRRMACDAHRALGCRDYSIYDVRIDPEDNVFMLESCLYCSFSHRSALALMASAGGVRPRRLFDQMADWAISRRRMDRSGGAVGRKSGAEKQAKGTKTRATGVAALMGGVVGMKAR